MCTLPATCRPLAHEIHTFGDDEIMRNHRISLLSVSIVTLLAAQLPVLAQSEDDPKRQTLTKEGEPGTDFERNIHERISRLRSDAGLPAVYAGWFEIGGKDVVHASGLRRSGGGEDNPRNQANLKDKLHLGSCTKAMTAFLVAQQVTQGKLRWDSTLAESFPELSELGESEWADVTIAEIMRHRSGLPANAYWALLDAEYPGDLVASRRALVDWVLTQRRPKKPKFLYSNVGYAILGHILESQEGIPWEKLIQERLFKPLGIVDAGFGPAIGSAANPQPSGHTAANMGTVIGSISSLFGAERKPSYSPTQIDNPPPLGPAGRVHMPLEQWAKFVAVLATEEPPDPALGVSAANWLELLSPGDEGNYAGGWIVGEREWAHGRVLNHAGSNTTWFCIAWLAPKRKSFSLVVTNCFESSVPTTCNEITGALIEPHRVEVSE